jgi:D-alanyl-D-alanine carboxypeptidase
MTVFSCREDRLNNVQLFLPRLLCGLLVCVIALAALSLPSEALANKKYASIVMDSDTGVILHQRHADKILHPASLTKMMTLVMVFDALDKRKLRLNDRILVSHHAASMVPSKLDIPAGQNIRVKHAIYALVTKSANDVAVAVAEKIGGSEERFAAMMTRKAR